MTAMRTWLRRQVRPRTTPLTRNAPFELTNVDEYLDGVRYQAFDLALRAIKREGVPGAIAELGVYKGTLSRFLYAMCPERDLYLLDSFGGGLPDGRFTDTSIAEVGLLGKPNVHVLAGWFPETADKIPAEERFAMVILDADIYESTLAGLRFFHPRIESGGYLFLHDFNNATEPGVREAVGEYFGWPSPLVELPDTWGSAVMRVMR